MVIISSQTAYVNLLRVAQVGHTIPSTPHAACASTSPAPSVAGQRRKTLLDEDEEEEDLNADVEGEIDITPLMFCIPCYSRSLYCPANRYMWMKVRL